MICHTETISTGFCRNFEIWLDFTGLGQTQMTFDLFGLDNVGGCQQAHCIINSKRNITISLFHPTMVP